MKRGGDDGDGAGKELSVDIFGHVIEIYVFICHSLRRDGYANLAVAISFV